MSDMLLYDDYKEVITFMGYDGTKNMSWKDVKDFIDKMPFDRLEDSASVFLPRSEEYYPIKAIEKTDDRNDVLEVGSYVLIADE